MTGRILAALGLCRLGIASSPAIHEEFSSKKRQLCSLPPALLLLGRRRGKSQKKSGGEHHDVSVRDGQAQQGDGRGMLMMHVYKA